MNSNTPLANLIDDTILWFMAWHRLAFANAETRQKTAPLLEPPASFARWRDSAAAVLPAEQPAIEKIAGLHEQLHTLARLVLLKTPDDPSLNAADDDSVTAKYLELIQGLRRLERAFNAAASELDPLTGLHTRAGLLRDLTREIKRFERNGRPFCVAIMDIDHFKQVNDTHGHEAGDRVLAATADHISRSLRAVDDAYRMGGEEFMLCLKETDLPSGVLALNRLRQSLAALPVPLPNGASITVTASFGVTLSQQGAAPDALLRRADQALYQAKREGRNRVVTG